MPNHTEIIDSIADKLAERLYDFTPAEAEFAVKKNLQIWQDGMKEFKSANTKLFGALKTGAVLYWNDIEQRLMDMSQVKKYISEKNPDLLRVPGIETYMRSQIKGFYNALYDYLFEE